jgi:hypothetical protein
MVRRLCTFAVVLLWAAFGAQAGGAPAVSGPSAKFSIEGGEYDDEGSLLALGSYTLPVGQAIGVQFDGALGSIDDEVMGGGGVHVFTRDPSIYLLGAYASYHTWDSIDIWRTAVEAELYLGRFSLGGLAGYESVDVPSVSNGLLVLNTDDDHFFAHADLAYYPVDNLKVTGGYRYLNETSLGSASAEYLIQNDAAPVSLFARCDFGDTDYNRITGGLKVYLGADPNKTLIKRHRTEDPENYTPVFPKLVTQSQSDQCQGEGVFSPSDTCQCPAGYERRTGDSEECSEYDLPGGCFVCRRPFVPY